MTTTHRQRRKRVNEQRKPYRIKGNVSTAAGMWYEHNNALRYHPLFPIVQDNETEDSVTMVCKYAGFHIHDSLPVRSIDVGAPDRWQAIAGRSISEQGEIVAKTKSLLLEKVDWHYMGQRPRGYVRGTRLRHED